MQATRREIVDILKRRAGATVDDLAKTLGLSPMCIRQHLALLERDGLVSPREVRRRTGRPHYFYTLTERADELFPKAYDRLAGGLIGYLKTTEGPERVSALLGALGDHLGEEYAQSLGDRPFEERLSAMVSALGEGSHLGEWEKVNGTYVLREYDCPFSRVSSRYPEVCDLHAQMLVRALNVETQRETNMARGDACCTYLLRPKAVGSA
ncbi:MAG: helix-turn-helix domain-containing protein [Dehalococcoidales bacterium]|nr:helix-turn-helix domain-containing protein [Dehalococcoidales bacterium]